MSEKFSDTYSKFTTLRAKLSLYFSHESLRNSYLPRQRGRES